MTGEERRSVLQPIRPGQSGASEKKSVESASHACVLVLRDGSTTQTLECSLQNLEDRPHSAESLVLQNELSPWSNDAPNQRLNKRPTK